MPSSTLTIRLADDGGWVLDSLVRRANACGLDESTEGGNRFRVTITVEPIADDDGTPSPTK